jgi:hypothetical protein
LVVYHGTKKGNEINIFHEREDSGTHFGSKKSAIDRRKDTGDFDYKLIECFLNIRNPLFVDYLFIIMEVVLKLIDLRVLNWLK